MDLLWAYVRPTLGVGRKVSLVLFKYSGIIYFCLFVFFMAAFNVSRVEQNLRDLMLTQVQQSVY